MKKLLAISTVLLSGVLLGACGTGPSHQGSSKKTQQTTTTTYPTTTTAPIDYEVESCASTIAGWRDWLSPRFLTGGYDNLYTLRASGLLWDTGGVGGEIGEWLRQNAANYAVQSVGGSNSDSYPLSQVSATTECKSLKAQGYDISQLPAPPY